MARGSSLLEWLSRLGKQLALASLAIVFTAAITLILLRPLLQRENPYDLSLGDIAPEDVRAPSAVTYTSHIETEAAREAARLAVDDVFGDPDPRIGRQQVRKAGQIMAFVQTVRKDSFASRDLQREYIHQIDVLDISPEVATLLLTVADNQFDLVRVEVVDLVERAMSGPVREGSEHEVIGQLELIVSADLPEELITPAVAITQDLIIPNTFLDVAATRQAEEAAVSSVREIRYSFQPGEVVIRAGEQVDELDEEALDALGLEDEAVTWESIAALVLKACLSTVSLSFFLLIRREDILMRPNRLWLLAGVLVFFCFIGGLMVSTDSAIAYIFPSAALALAFAALVNLEFALMCTAVLALLVGPFGTNPLEMTTYIGVTGFFAAGSFQRDSRLSDYFLAGMVAALSGIVVLLMYRLPLQLAPIELAVNLLIAVLGGALSAGLALVIMFVAGNATDITTALQLIDLTRPDHPLQRQLQREAIGTYHHTLAVANLAEAAAEAVGADRLLTRVGVLYHDIGKTKNPGFFVENRIEGLDPHADLLPVESARIIIAHVTDGATMARQHRLPSVVVDFILEHHGTRPVVFFLAKAKESARSLGIALADEDAFHYPGPIPQSRETGITLLADSCESATRAIRPRTAEEIESIVEKIFKENLDLGQLDASGLTLTDIQVIRDTIVYALKGMYHPRVQYPENPEIDSPVVESDKPTIE